jgi:hypothetical protein
MSLKNRLLTGWAVERDDIGYGPQLRRAGVTLVKVEHERADKAKECRGNFQK